MKIAFLGAGALGSAIGGSLAEGGADVVLVDAWRDHVDAINRDGLTLREGGSDRKVRVRAAASADGLGTVDLVVVLVKSYDTRAAIEQGRRLVGPDTVVMSLQNGLGHEDVLADVVGRERVIAGKTYKGGVLLGPGQVIAGVRGKETVIGELDGRVTDRVRRIAEAFAAAGLDARVSGDIVGTMWDKLMINVATGALAGITRLPYGELYDVPEVEACALAAVDEALAAAKASGVRVSWADARAPWLKAKEGLPPEFRTSMLQSLEKGSRTEIDYVNGAVVRAGERCGVATPVNRTLVACVKGLERRNARFGKPA
ncbi:MAG: 2-dehydropantoate 2-reductase [Betaproteobacteria bacterium]|nr:MAG: 2-dehydropantoate 2-reductase [Betaproteobacteria bacterium]